MQHSLKPYLINAFYTWSMDIGYTPLLTVQEWADNIIPEHLAKESHIIFNIHPTAVKNLIFGKNVLEFDAMFAGVPHHVALYYKSIFSIYNKEDSYGLEFEVIMEKKEPKKPNLILIKNENFNF